MTGRIPTSGIRAEYNRDFFADVSAQVITKSIAKRRNEIGATIRNDGQSKSVVLYSLEAVIADVVAYHGACSLVAGLEFADGAVVTIGGPNGATLGLDVLKAQLSAKAPSSPDTSPPAPAPASSAPSGS